VTREEFGRAYEHEFDDTVRFLLSRGVRPRDTAADAAQAGWTKGWEKIDQLRNESLLKTWVNSIALNVYRSSLRREPMYQTLPDLVSKTGINLAALEVRRVLRTCHPSDRKLLEQQMRGLTAEEIAKHLGITVTAVRVRFVRARRAARMRLEMRAALNR
jgi:RNA polymerase sigma factor (sigma-70 family)